jgi:hypothetical protein
MNSQLLEELLYEEESPTLDFKRDAYPFEGATNEKKSELLKDIISFANAWRRADAFILIGIEEVKGGRSQVIGISEHVDDADIQQFINSKTNRPVNFSYITFSIEGRQIGVIRIPVQDRPVFLTKDYGNLKKDTVYLRRGSSTDIAKPDEIARMGSPLNLAASNPSIDLQFADSKQLTLLGSSIKLVSRNLIIPPESEIPDTRGGGSITGSLLVNTDYYRLFGVFLASRSLFSPIRFWLKNTGTALLSNARLEITLQKQPYLQSEVELPHPPDYRTSLIGSVSLFQHFRKTNLRFIDRDTYWKVIVDFGNIQPKATMLSDTFYLGATQPIKIQLESLVYADNLPDPVQGPLTVDITVENQEMDVKKLLTAADRYQDK